MDAIVVQLIRDLGPVGVLAVALYAVAKALTPALTIIGTALQDGAEARRAVLKRWEDSDKALEKNSAGLDSAVDAIRAVGDEMKALRSTSEKQLEQDSAHTASITKLGTDIADGRKDAVKEVKDAMNERFDQQDKTLTTVTQTLEDMKTEFNRRIDEVLARLHAQAPPVPEPPAVGKDTPTNTDLQVLKPVSSEPPPASPPEPEGKLDVDESRE